MRKLTLLLLLQPFLSISQRNISEKIQDLKSKTEVKNYSIFTLDKNIPKAINSFKPTGHEVYLITNIASIADISQKSDQFLTLKMAINDSSNLELEVFPVEILMSNFKVLNSNGIELPYSRGKFFHGIIKNNPNSIVAISIIDNEFEAVISDSTGNRYIGKSKTDAKNYVFYSEQDLLQNSPQFQCNVYDENFVMPNINLNTTAIVNCTVVPIYLEADFATYHVYGSDVQLTTNYITNIFNQAAMIYNNEGINIAISEIKIWNTPDPYISATTNSQFLNAFKSNVPTYNGKLAHLLSTRNMSGGLGELNVLCANTGYAMSSQLGFVANFPNYSWAVNEFAHELGHNFGSPHTHNCSWSGGPIDNCGPIAGNPTEGSCGINGPTPAFGGGTIMSYCHLLNSIGVNFANGFGQLPGNLLRSNTQNCFGSANPPIGLNTVEVYKNKALLVWQNNSHLNPYVVEYRQTGATNWLLAGNTSFNSFTLNGLSPNTNYEWRIKVDCSTYTTSSFSTNNIDPPQDYCAVTINNPCVNGIYLNDVIVDGQYLSQNSGCSGGFALFTENPITLSTGRQYNFTLNLGGYYNGTFATIWIDVNKDGLFQSNEKVFTSSSANFAPIVANFTVPVISTNTSNTRMRVIINFNNAVNTACGNFFYTEVEDYLVNICSVPIPSISQTGNIPLCYPATSITLTASGCINGTINWNTIPIVSGNSLTVTETGTYAANCTNSCGISGLSTAAIINSNCPCIINYSKNSGNWSDTNIWSCGHIPLPIETVEIKTGTTVTLNEIGYASTLIENGDLIFGINANLQLNQYFGTITLSGNMNFGQVPIGQTVRRNLIIQNTGDPITISSISLPVGYSATYSGQLATNASVIVVVSFTPNTEADYSGQITVNSSPNAAGNTINTSATGIANTINNGLVMYLPFNGNTNDISGNNNHGIASGGTLFNDRNGISNNAYWFLRSANNYLTVPNNTSIDLTGPAMSMCAWIRPTWGGLFANMQIMSKAQDGANRKFGLGTDSPNLMNFELKTNTGTTDQNWSCTNCNLQENVWQFVTVTYDGTNMKWYKNGQLLYQIAKTGNIVSTTNDLTIGVFSSKTVSFFNGFMDEIRLYNRALTDAEILLLAQL